MSIEKKEEKNDGNKEVVTKTNTVGVSGNSIETRVGVEYETSVANAIFEVCTKLFGLSMPDAILRFIAELSSLRADTQLLQWDEVEWIYNEVIPNQYMTSKIYSVDPDNDDDDNDDCTGDDNDTNEPNDNETNDNDKNDDTKNDKNDDTKNDKNGVVSFKKYDSYQFHDCVDDKGPTIFICECNNSSMQQPILIGGYCNQSWFSPYKKEKDSKQSNGGYYVPDSQDCKLFVIRNDELTDKFNEENLSLPLLAKLNNPENRDIMVAANRDGPNFGFNHFYITASGTISMYDKGLFQSPVDCIKNFKSFMTGTEMKHAVTRMEVFAIDDITT